MEALAKVKNYRGRMLENNKQLLNLGKFDEYRNNCNFIAGMTKAIQIIEAERCR